jgi:hypothetical protein
MSVFKEHLHTDCNVKRIFCPQKHLEAKDFVSFHFFLFHVVSTHCSGWLTDKERRGENAQRKGNKNRYSIVLHVSVFEREP